MTTITIPPTLAEAVAALGGLGRLLTAKGWERAAIVYAFTFEAGSGRPPANKKRKSEFLSTYEFADLGIHGLQSPQTVLRYRRNWQEAIDLGLAKEVNPGDTITLPEREYPANSREKIDGEPSEGIRDRMFANTPPDRKAAAILEAMEQDEDAARLVENAFVQKAGQDPELMMRISDVYAEHHTVPPHRRGRPTSLGTLGFGASLYQRILKEGKEHLDPLLDYLRQQAEAGDPEIRLLAGEVNDNLEKGVGLLRGYQDQVHKAVGVDADATFARLLGE